MRRLGLCLAIMATAIFACAADEAIEVIHFKDGTSIRGRITERESYPAEKITILGEDGKSHTFEMDKVERISSSVAEAAKAEGSGGTGPSSFFAVNYLGLLQFGPILQFGFSPSKDMYIVPYFRFHGLGALSWLLGDWEKSVLDSAAGLEFEVLQPLGRTNSMYYGLGADCLICASNDFFNQPPVLDAFANIGHRWWNPGPRNFLNVGVIAGISYDFLDRYLVPFAMVEITSGWPLSRR